MVQPKPRCEEMVWPEMEQYSRNTMESGCNPHDEMVQPKMNVATAQEHGNVPATQIL